MRWWVLVASGLFLLLQVGCLRNDPPTLFLTGADGGMPDAALPAADCTEDPACPCSTVSAGLVEIFAFEASRPGSSGGSEGSADDHACSKAGVRPWTGVTQAQAAAACAASGFRLCTQDEWQRACGGPSRKSYPYGGTEKVGICNDFLAGSSQPLPGGAKTDCVSPEGVYDMVGNVWEWVTAASGGKLYVGGSYQVTQATRSLHPNNCNSQMAPAGMSDQAEDVGFRCCRTPGE